jgi:LysR family transcriptional regulator, glycine cleavage system transcriptional activator
MNAPRQRPLAVGPLRAFEAVARRASFRAAAEELHLTQPAVSRQIRALEEELGVTLFSRGTRHVALTPAGATLLRTAAPWLARLDDTVRQLRGSAGRRHVAVSTFASFASLWLLPRLHGFQARHPDIDLRISASDAMVDPDDPDIDAVLRYVHPDQAPPGGEVMFGEVLTPVIGAAAAEAIAAGRLPPLRTPADLAAHTLLEEDDHRASAEYLSWRHWLRTQGQPGLEPRRWIYLNFTYQQIQAAIGAQGIALARIPLVHDLLARGELIEPFGPAGRVASPFAYWVAAWPGARLTPPLRAFMAWVTDEAALTRQALAQTPVG